MKWPSSLTLVRHAESDYNALRGKKEALPGWGTFTKLFNKGYNSKKFDSLVFYGEWPSPELVALAREMQQKIRDIFGSPNDFETPITNDGWQQARVTGARLREEKHPLPDIVYLSPYLRTRQTHEGVAGEWPELKRVQTTEEERIREQEHGKQSLYGDWRVFSVFHPLDAVARKQSRSYYYRHPEGESVCNVRERTRDFLGMLIREHREQHVVAFTHHLTILSTRANLERWGQEDFINADEHDKPVNCGVTIYRGMPDAGKDGRLQLEIYNRKLY